MALRQSAISGLQKTVAENLKARRLRLDLSQENLADICGYHRTYIGSIERAERNITLSTLEAISRALGVSPIELMQEPNG
jgi:transcriptional regulator with XRE-family HTH domain